MFGVIKQMMAPCRQISHLISQEQDRPLTFSQRWGLRLHVMMCTPCRRYRQSVATLTTMIRRLLSEQESDQDIQLSPDSRARITRLLDDPPDHA